MRKSLHISSYQAPFWLRGGHLQTLYATLAPFPRKAKYRRERWSTPDGDFIDLDWLLEATSKKQPLLVLLHGLEGHSNSHYATSLMNKVDELGWNGVVVHFRGCSGELNLLPRAYHAGDAQELDWIFTKLTTISSATKIYVVGVSLGGNALLKWLAQENARAAGQIQAAAAVCAPLDLQIAGDTLASGFNIIYTKFFLRSLKRKAKKMLVRHPKLFDVRLLKRARNLRDFDDLVTAPLHNFSSVDDYWERASSKNDLLRITTPTLVINALNDPFLPMQSLPNAEQVSAAVTLEYPDQGGHVGFVSGRFPGNLDWLPWRLIDFFKAH